MPLSSAPLQNSVDCAELISGLGFQRNSVGTHLSVDGVRHFLEKTSVEASHFPINARVGTFWGTALRGVGGVTRLKLRFKGKSFKWHRRKGALMLRFGHSHLVALTPYPGVR